MKRLSIKIGQTEIVLESDDLAGEVATLKEALSLVGSFAPAGISKASAGAAPQAQQASAGDFEQSMSTYVARLKADSARKIMQAAAYNLVLCDNKDHFTRAELYEKARQASTWKADYTNQQAINLNRMVSSGELIERPGGRYTVPPAHIEGAKQAILAHG